MTNAISFAWVVFTPIASAAMWLSRMLVIARPVRPCRRLRARTKSTIVTASVR
jgi:hypothetical protein